jgi:hypothetical protein
LIADVAGFSFAFKTQGVLLGRSTGRRNRRYLRFALAFLSKFVRGVSFNFVLPAA